MPGPVFVNVYGAQESTPRNRFRQHMYPGGPVTTNRVVVAARQAGNRFLSSLKGLQIRALYARMGEACCVCLCAWFVSVRWWGGWEGRGVEEFLIEG